MDESEVEEYSLRRPKYFRSSYKFFLTFSAKITLRTEKRILKMVPKVNSHLLWKKEVKSHLLISLLDACLMPKAHHHKAGAQEVAETRTPGAGMLGHRHYLHRSSTSSRKVCILQVCPPWP